MAVAEEVGSAFALQFGERVKVLRKQKGIKQKALADMLGYKSHTAIVHMENGLQAPSLEMALLLARALGVSLKELLGDLLFDADQEGTGIDWLAGLRTKATAWPDDCKMTVAGLLKAMAYELETACQN